MNWLETNSHLVSAASLCCVPVVPLLCSTMPKVKVSVIQCGSRYGDMEGTLGELDQFAATAAEQGSKLAVFPEAYLGGYPKLSSFGCSVGARDPKGREEYLQYHHGAISLASDQPTPELDRVIQTSAHLDIFLVVGVIEKEGGSLFCTAIFIHPAKGLVGKHRKLMPSRQSLPVKLSV